MSAIMSSIIGDTDRHANEEWRPQDDRRRSVNPAIDIEADRQMTDLVAARNNIVVDAWMQPWLYQGNDAMRIWIESDTSSRIMKCRVSFLRARRTPPSDVAELVARKDAFSELTYMKLYGVTFAPDPAVFDLIIDNSQYIHTPTIADSDRGISGFHRELVSTILAINGSIISNLGSPLFISYDNHGSLTSGS